MPKPYPREFRDDVVRIAQGRDPGVTVEQIAKDFGVHPMTLFKWLRICTPTQIPLNWAASLVARRWLASIRQLR